MGFDRRTRSLERRKEPGEEEGAWRGGRSLKRRKEPSRPLLAAAEPELHHRVTESFRQVPASQKETHLQGNPR